MMYAQEIAEHLHTMGTDAPAVYVGTYGKYNSGSLAGEWLDISTFYDWDEYKQILALLHADENDPEYMVQDFENFPKEWYAEWINEDTFWKIKGYAEMDDDDKEKFEIYMDEIDEEITPDEFNDSIGWLEYDDLEDYGRQALMVQHSFPSWVERYIDFKLFAREELECRDAEENGFHYVENNNGVIVFYNK